jgi:hypothetical protein
MNFEVAMEFVDLANQLVKSAAGIEDKTLAEILIEIVRKAAGAYHDHIGEPIDPQLITAIDPI